ncbi:MAG: ribonuclease R [Phycisphaerae bacterium]|nr:ribonuclease R [Phycisphaerae bacterium]
MPSRQFTERILNFVQAEGYEPRKLSELAEAMGIAEDEAGDFHSACRALMRSGRIVLGTRNAVLLGEPPGRIVGRFRGNPRGFGFVVPDTPNAYGDLFVPPNATGGAITGDTVSARVFKRGKREGRMVYEGQITSIVKRGQNRFVGELSQNMGKWFVVPEGNALHAPIQVGDPGAKGARTGDQVVVELTEYPSAWSQARGVIVRVLGPRGEPGVETTSIIEQYQLPGEFPEDVLKEARQRVTSYDESNVKRNHADREDLSGETIITIDPEDARDFDDAISLKRHDNGTFELGVHIADVAAFVPEDGPLDLEARERSNSVYLPDLVIPMLPEVLSNGVCSLQERRPRLTKSAFISYDAKGKVRGARFANSIIRSVKRLTYEQAGRVLEGKPGRLSAKVVTLIRDMEALARILQARRRRQGMLEIDMPEAEIVYDENRNAVDVRAADTGYSHKIIEMFMVEANEAVARKLREIGVPCLRRIHEEPEDLTGGNLQRLLRVLGHELTDDADRFALQALIDSVRGKDEAFAVNLATLRSMPQAEYSPELAGHYALASENYCHFTSPIRRYPDLTVHRLLDAHLRGGLRTKAEKSAAPSEEELKRLGRQCSENERRAEAAERELILVLTLKMLEKKIGESFGGVVTGVANIGVFVQLDHYFVDGLLRFDALPDDWWEVDAPSGAVIGERTGRQITVGDRLKVTVDRVHVPTRRLDLALAEELPAPKGGKRTKKIGKSGARRDRSGGSKRGRAGRSEKPGRRAKKKSNGKDSRSRKRKK